MTVKQIFSACKKRHGRSRYLLFVPVKISAKDTEGREKTAEARIVCVRNRQNRKDWIAIISTDMSLSEEEIIRLYGRKDEDERAIGELFYLMVKEIADVTFQQSMMILQEVMLASIKTVFNMAEGQIQAVVQDFVDRLQEYMRGALQKSVE